MTRVWSLADSNLDKKTIMDEANFPPRRVVMLVVDQFGAGMTSTYGNTCFDTMHLNSLAGESLVFDFALAQHPNPTQFYAGLQERIQQAQSRKRFSSCLITDDENLADSSVVDCFDEVISTQVVHATGLARELEQTELAQYFAQVSQWLSSPAAQSFDVCWLHCRGLAAAWDAPFSIRQSLADEDDPEPPKFFEPPSIKLDGDSNPDQLLGMQQVAAAQVAVLDQCLGVLLDQLARPEFENSLVGFTSIRGCPLGEHGQVGLSSNQDQLEGEGCYSELLHVPMMLRFPQASPFHWAAVSRNIDLLAHESLLDLPLKFLQEEDEPLQDRLQELIHQRTRKDQQWVISQNGPYVALQTHAWKLILNQDTGESELYAKPDDRWEVNEVSRRCAAVVEQMTELLPTLPTESQDDVTLSEELVTRQ